jgi:23S rRNA (guanosine2251-2'-O)-methyltransferase
MENDHQIFRTRAIIEAIQAGATVNKVYIQNEVSSELMKDLMKVIKGW